MSANPTEPTQPTQAAHMAMHARVLCRDYNNIWCPLSELYWAAKSSQLVSRHPLSSLQEVISIYCPQCLARYSEDEASSSLGCCTVCKQCPHCRGTLAPHGSGIIIIDTIIHHILTNYTNDAYLSDTY
jgi:dynactin-4